MRDSEQIRQEIIALLENALGHATELNLAMLGYLIQCALDEARGQMFRVPE